jgi:Ca2+:H+ antiporter
VFHNSPLDSDINIFITIQATAVVNSGLLLMAVMGLMFPAVLHFTHSEARQGASELALSRFSSCIMLLAYASYLYFQLSGRTNTYSPIGNVIPVPFLFFSLYV